MKKNYSFKKLFSKAAAILLVLTVFASSVPVYAEEAGFSAEDLTLQPGSSQNEINLNWYAESGVSDARVRFKTKGLTLSANASESVASSGKISCKATVTGLEEDTEYKYQISNDGGVTWSREYDYRSSDGGDFTFAFVGDPQLNAGEQDPDSAVFSADKTTLRGWQDTLSAVSEAGAEFIASAGDQVNSGGSETQYADFFAPAQMQSLPFAAAVGNHDPNEIFLYHFNLPNEQDVRNILGNSSAAGATTASGNYFYSYNNALFVVLNTSPSPGSKAEAEPYVEAYEKTIKSAIEKYPDYKWLFVQHHRSTESVAQHVADWDLMYYVEAGFERLMDKYHVDFVLAGHDHVYARTWAMNGGKRVDGTGGDAMTDPAGTVYLTCNTASGLKYYHMFEARYIYIYNNDQYPLLANGLRGSAEYLKGVFPLSTNVARQNRIPGYTIIKVSDERVDFATYATYEDPNDGGKTLIDSFTVKKTTDYHDIAGHWAKDDIESVTEKGTFEGTDTNIFSPDENMTRAMLVTVLHRMAGSPAEGRNPFTDVKSGRYFTQAVAWASSNKIVEGTSKTTFSPHDDITREEIATMLYRYAGYEGKNTDKSDGLAAFKDSGKISPWAQDAMEWAVAEGLFRGDENEKLNPSDRATRAEVATLVNRYMNML